MPVLILEDRLVKEALLQIQKRYEDCALLERLWFHDTKHTVSVIAWATQIAVAMELPRRDIVIVQCAAAYHDREQSWVMVREESGIIRRRMHVGLNETASAHGAVSCMEEADELCFTPFEMGLAASAIIATISEWSAEHMTAIQPLLTPDSHPVVRAVALADLGAAGMDPLAFSREGMRLFAEEQIDIMIAVHDSQKSSYIDAARQRQYRERLIEWLGAQPAFVRGRQERLEEELSLRTFPRDVQERLLGLFGSFDASARLAEKNVEMAKAMDFVSLMRSVGKDAFPVDA